MTKYFAALLLLVFTTGMTYGQGQGAGGQYYHFDTMAIVSNNYVKCRVYGQEEKEGELADSIYLYQEFEFDSVGRIVTETNHDHGLVYLNSYDGDKLTKTEFIPLGDSVYETYVFKYNEEGLEVLRRTIARDGSESTRIVSNYKEGRLEEEVYFISEVERTHWVYTYDQNDVLHQRQTLVDGKPHGMWTYSFDERGNLVEFIIYDKRTELVTRHKRYYNSSGRLVKNEVHGRDNLLSSLHETVYDKQGLILEQITTYGIKGDDFQSAEKTLYKYKYEKASVNTDK